MKHLEKHRVHKDTKDVPEGEIFCVYEESAGKSMFVLTPSIPNRYEFCFAVKIKGQVYTSDWLTDSAPKNVVKDAMKQILFIKQGGWYATGEKRLDDMNLFRENLFRCAYCKTETTDVKGPCSCRLHS